MEHRPLGTSGLRVTDRSLGTTTTGEDWGRAASPAAGRAILDAYAVAGGNVVDTAINDTNGSSDRIDLDGASALALGFPHDIIRESAAFVCGAAGCDVVPRRDSRPNPGGARAEGDPAA